MIATTETWLLYLLILIAGFSFVISTFLWYSEEPGIVSVFLMGVSSLISFKISNIFIDGTLTKTTSFLSNTNEVITSTEVIRNTAASNLFELFGIVLFILILIQIYDFVKDTGIEEELKDGF